MLSLSQMDQIQSQIVTPRLSVSSASSSSLIATVEEVKEFFDNYVRLFAQKDIGGFLSLFSSKVVGNHKDGIETIRKIYTDFFNQSDELRYRIRYNTEIYQNAVEVKGFYEIDQLNKKGRRKVWTGPIRWVLTREDRVLKVVSVDYQHDKSQ
jgi:hypothetical protein